MKYCSKGCFSKWDDPKKPVFGGDLKIGGANYEFFGKNILDRRNRTCPSPEMRVFGGIHKTRRPTTMKESMRKVIGHEAAKRWYLAGPCRYKVRSLWRILS